jgi:Rrf2 family protein
MIYSRSAEYAIRACIDMAELETGTFAMVKQIAERTGAPSHFLSKILQQLAREGLLRSNKGPTGGFCLRMPAQEMSLWTIVSTIDGTERYQRCSVGFAECNDDQPCPMHDGWKALRAGVMGYLEGTSISDLAKAAVIKRSSKGKKPKKAAVKKK